MTSPIVVKVVRQVAFQAKLLGRGIPGVGIPTGGTTGQTLVKLSNTPFHTGWATPSGGGGGGTGAFADLTGSPYDNANLTTALNAKADAGSLTSYLLSSTAASTYATQSSVTSALAGKEPTITAGTTAQYWRGDKSWQPLDKAAVGLGNVDNTADTSKPVSTLQAAADAVVQAYAIQRGNHTGTQLAATISDFNTAADARITAQKGAANGLATLDATSKIPLSQMPSSMLGAAIYQGAWNATTNSPALASGTGTKGYYYVVSVAGTAALDGESDWKLGDWAIYNGTVWQKVDNTDAVISVAGRVGAVTLTSTDVGLGNVDNTSDVNKPVSTAQAAAIAAKQDTLVSGTNIKTVNGTSILGAGNISITSGTAIGDTISGATAGSIFFAGAAGILSQDNSGLFYNSTNKNIGLNTATPNAKLVMDFNTTTQGFRPPVLNNTQMYAIASPPTGSMVVHSDTNKIWGYGIGYGFGWKPLYTPILTPSYFEETTMWFQQQGQYGTKAIALKAPVSIPIDLPDVFLPSRTGTIALEPRVVGLTDAATVTPDCNVTDIGTLATLSRATTFANPTGTPKNMQPLTIFITSSAAQTLAFGTNYIGSTDTPLPTTTTGGAKTDVLGFRYYSALSKWMFVARNFGF